MPIDPEAPTWLIILLLALLMLSPLAVGAVNRRFQARERQPARGLSVGSRPLDAAQAAFLNGLKRDIQTVQQVRRRTIVTGYVTSPLDGGAIVCRTYRFGRQGAYVGIANPAASPPVLDFRASPLHLALRTLVLIIVAALALLLELPLWLALIFVALIGWVFWFDHRNELADQLAHLAAVMKQQAQPTARRSSLNRSGPTHTARNR